MYLIVMSNRQYLKQSFSKAFTHPSIFHPFYCFGRPLHSNSIDSYRLLAQQHQKQAHIQARVSGEAKIVLELTCGTTHLIAVFIPYFKTIKLIMCVKEKI